MASKVILNPRNSTTITVKTMTGKIFEMDFEASNKTKTINDVKNWLSDNHGIVAKYQELFDEAPGGKIMDNAAFLSELTGTTLHLVIKPMPKFELVVYCYAFFKINAASAWKVAYLYKALAEACNFQNEKHIEIEVQEHNGTVRPLLKTSQMSLEQESIDAECTLKVYRMLDISVTELSGEKKSKTVRIHNKFETVKDLLKKFRKEFNLGSKPKARCKGEFIPKETRLVELSFEKIEVVESS